MDSSAPLARPLAAMALGRIALGIGSLASPGGTARTFGARPSAELDYMTRVFGARAIALGLAYLMAPPAQRTRLQRLCLGVDLSDTVAGISELVRPTGAPRAAIGGAVVLTGTYAALGAARFVADLQRGR